MSFEERIEELILMETDYYSPPNRFIISEDCTHKGSEDNSFEIAASWKESKFGTNEYIHVSPGDSLYRSINGLFDKIHEGIELTSKNEIQYSVIRETSQSDSYIDFTDMNTKWQIMALVEVSFSEVKTGKLLSITSETCAKLGMTDVTEEYINSISVNFSDRARNELVTFSVDVNTRYPHVNYSNMNTREDFIERSTEDSDQDVFSVERMFQKEDTYVFKKYKSIAEPTMDNTITDTVKLCPFTWIPEGETLLVFPNEENGAREIHKFWLRAYVDNISKVFCK